MDEGRYCSTLVKNCGERNSAHVGNPAAMALARCRPVALRPHLSTGLPSVFHYVCPQPATQSAYDPAV